jgi:hypothetical protein
MDFEVAASRPTSTMKPKRRFGNDGPNSAFTTPLPKQYMRRVEEYFADLAILVLHEGRVAAGR